MTRRRLLWLALTGFAVGAAGCGKKGPLERPNRAKDGDKPAEGKTDRTQQGTEKKG